MILTTKYFLLTLRDIIAPPRCISCLQEGSWHCFQCRQNFRLSAQKCLICLKKQPRGLTCPECRQSTPITGTISAGAYHAEALRRGIHWLKFKHVRQVAPALASLLVPALPAIAPLPQLRQEAVIIPVPLHARRRRQRGFNQTEELAEQLSNATNLPLSFSVIRSRPTWSQAKLPAELRQQNTQAAFRLVEPLPNKKFYILLDDVITSGATSSAAAQALWQSPALPKGAQIWALAVARG